MKFFKREIETKKFVVILVSVLVLLATAITIPIAVNGGDDENKKSPVVHTHTFGEVTYEWNQDNTACTATRVCAKDETHIETERATATKETTKQPNCTEKGETTYTATFENAAFIMQTKTVADIPIDETNHDYGEVTYEWNQDNTACTATRFCAKDETHIETESATVTKETTKQPTYLEKGETTYTATFENTAFETQTKTVADIPYNENEHNYGELTVAWNGDYTDCEVTRACSCGYHVEMLAKTIETASDGAKTIKVYDGNGEQIALFVYKQKTLDDGYYLYQSEVRKENHILYQTFNESGNLLSSAVRLIFEGYAPDSDDSEFGEP